MKSSRRKVLTKHGGQNKRRLRQFNKENCHSEMGTTQRNEAY